MDIRKWLNAGPKGLKKQPKSPKLVKKGLESSDEDEEPIVIKPKKEKVKSQYYNNKENQKVTSPMDFFSPTKESEKPKENPKKQASPKEKPKKETSPKKKAKKQDSNPAPPKPDKRALPMEETSSSPAKKKQKVERDSNPPPKESKDETMDTSLNESTTEKKKFNYFAYKAKLDAGPKNPGSKEVPKGAPNCLEGSTFVITGTGDAFTRDETKSMIERYGGKVTSAVSGKTAYLVVGDDPGESKIKKATEKGVKQIDEDELLELIKTKPGKKSKFEIAAEEEVKRETPKKKPKKEPKQPEAKPEPSQLQKTPSTEAITKKVEKVKIEPEMKNEEKTVSKTPPSLWVEKYKPVSLGKIVGQAGAASCAKKLLNWLKGWEANQGGPKETRKKGAWKGGKIDDPTGASLRAALLSGPPGVGKTTTAHQVARELGMDVVEYNASDTRSKKSITQVVNSAAGCFSVTHMLKSGNKSKQQKVVVMDEVDGMAGNEDRGGIAELIQVIKNSSVPIICICNDRQHQKIRSLAGHCFDLRFQKPRVEQITGAMMSICYKEGFKIAAPAVQNIIRACNQDIRQTINTLSMMASNNNGKVEYEDTESVAKECKKDLKHGPFDVARKIKLSKRTVFYPGKTINERVDCFFEDYSLIPKFNFENYPSVRPSKASNTKHHLKLLAQAASAFSYSNLAESKIMKTQSWGLLQTQAAFAAVIPCAKLAGSHTGMINFPSELGKISTTNKNARLSDLLKFHTALKSPTNRLGMVTEMAPTYRANLTEPLIAQSKGSNGDGVQNVIDFMDAYDLTKDDMDSIIDLTQLPGMKDPMKSVDTKTKSALTRTYNKLVVKRSYNIEQKVKGKKTKKKDDDEFDGSEAEESDEDSDVDISAYQKKAKAKKAPAKSKKPKK